MICNISLKGAADSFVKVVIAIEIFVYLPFIDKWGKIIASAIQLRI